MQKKQRVVSFWKEVLEKKTQAIKKTQAWSVIQKKDTSHIKKDTRWNGGLFPLEAKKEQAE